MPDKDYMTTEEHLTRLDEQVHLRHAARRRAECQGAEVTDEEKRAKAMQDLVELSEELGLYDMYYETDAAGEPRVVRHEQDPAAG